MHDNWIRVNPVPPVSETKPVQQTPNKLPDVTFAEMLRRLTAEDRQIAKRAEEQRRAEQHDKQMNTNTTTKADAYHYAGTMAAAYTQMERLLQDQVRKQKNEQIAQEEAVRETQHESERELGL